MKTATKRSVKKPETLLEEIKDLVYNHAQTVEAIISAYSYATEESMTLELNTSLENLKSKVEKFEEEEFNDLLEKVKKHDEFDKDEVISFFEIETKSQLSDFDFDEVKNYVSGEGYCFIDLKGSIDNAAKLEAFVKAEIYPHYNDQQEYLIL